MYKYKCVYTKEFQRSHKLDKVCTEEIIKLPSDSKKMNPWRFCLNKFIYPYDFQMKALEIQEQY